MRKFLLAMVLVLSFALPSWAGPALIINGALYPNAQTIEQDGMVYVPVHPTAEAIGYEVGFEDGAVKIWQQLKEPQIIGDSHFQEVVGQAIGLLRENEPVSYVNLCQYVDTIELSEQQGRDGHNNGGRQVYLTRELYDSDRFIPVYVAATIVHETVHAMQFGWGFNRVMTENALEYEAYGHDINILTQLNAPQWMIDGIVTSQNKYKPN